MKLGTASTYGFTAFFKTNNNRPAVQQVFQNMALGAPVPLGGFDAEFYGGQSTAPPTFICLDQGNPDTLVMWNFCQNHPAVAAFQLGGSNWITLCPYYWTLGGIPAARQCPSVVNNELTPNNAILVWNQFGVLVHELAHMYGVQTDEETFMIQDAVNLDATQSVANAQNYAMYAAGRFVFIK